MKLLSQEVLNRGPLDLEETLPAAGLSPDLPAPVHLKVHAEALGDDEILVLIQADTMVALACARCLAPFKRAMKASLELHVPASNEGLDAAEEARQSLVLALPVKPLCRPDCRGLCPRCGENLNVGRCGCPPERGDKPFAVLKDLKID